MSNLQQQIQDAVNAKIGALITQAIDSALGGGSTPVAPTAQPNYSANSGSTSNGGSTSNSGATVQDLADSVRRALRYSRNGHSLSKKERNLMARAVKAAKESYNITSGNNDLFTRAGC